MNAYELADDAKNIGNAIEALEWVQKAVPMLRQQADRLALIDSPPSVLIQIIDSQRAAIEFIKNNE
jgi:hypothetical protein